MKTLTRVPGSVGLRRPFAISCGLMPGYVGADAHDLSDALAVIRSWQTMRLQAYKPILTGAVVQTTIAYGWRTDHGTSTVLEPGIEYRGDTSTIYAADTTDSEVEEMLDDLGDFLGTNLEQTRVYVAYRERTWVLQASGKTSPREAART